MWQDSIREDDYPHLYSFAKDPSISIQKARNMISENIYDLFNLPLSMVAQAELDDLQNEAHEMIPSQNNDEWSFSWGNKFSTSKLYRVLIGDHDIPNPILDIWKTCVVPRQKFFSWLLLNGKLNFKEMMLKKKFMWSSLNASFVTPILWNPLSTCFLNVLSVRVSGGLWISNGILILTSTI
jgi:hypothetical protein